MESVAKKSSMATITIVMEDDVKDIARIRFVTVNDAVYLRVEDVAQIIRSVAGTEEANCRNRLDELAVALLQIKRKKVS